MSLSFLQFWGDIISIAYYINLRMEFGGDLLHLIMRYGIICVMMAVVYIPRIPVVALVVSTSAVSRPPSMVSTSAKVSSS